MIKHKNAQSGFTLLELLVAIAIFATFVVIAANILSNIMNTERKTSVLRTTQEKGRYILEEITREARNANGILDAGGMRITSGIIVNSQTSLTLSNTNFNSANPTDSDVTQISYNLINPTDIANRQISRVVSVWKIGSPTTVTTSSSVISNKDDITIKQLNFSSSSPADINLPPKLDIIFEIQNTKGLAPGMEIYQADTNLTTSVTPRNY